jgi:hypothetical protein
MPSASANDAGVDAAFGAADDSISREMLLKVKLTLMRVPVAQPELDGQCAQIISAGMTFCGAGVCTLRTENTGGAGNAPLPRNNLVRLICAGALWGIFLTRGVRYFQPRPPYF